MTGPTHRNALAGGSELHWFRMQRVLGQGGFGITYLARDLNLDQEVAIKEYFPADLVVRAEDDTVQVAAEDRREEFRRGLERFLSEGRVLARFDHPNIVRVHSVFRENNSAYLVMRYETGETLQDFLRRENRIAEGLLRRMFGPLLQGLAHVHAAGFIHRDIKPANIFVRDNGDPVLIDFGSARQPCGTATHTITRLVSPGYAPIEQYQGNAGRQGPCTDIYALGAVIYRATVGRPPVDAVERSQGIMKGADPLTPATRSMHDCRSPALLAAIDHALAFAPEDRPQSLAEWAVELGMIKRQSAGSGIRAVAAAPRRAAYDPESTIPSRVARLPAPASPRTGGRTIFEAKPAAGCASVVALPLPARPMNPTAPAAISAPRRRWPYAASICVGIALAFLVGRHAVLSPAEPAVARAGASTVSPSAAHASKPAGDRAQAAAPAGTMPPPAGASQSSVTPDGGAPASESGDARAALRRQVRRQRALAIGAWRRGDPGTARAHIDAALRLVPGNESLREIQRRLKQPPGG